MSIWKWDKAGLFVAGMLFATKGIEILASKPAHDVYVQATALALRGRDEVMGNVTAVRENCEDIYAEAMEVNRTKGCDCRSKDEIIEDKSYEAAEGTGPDAE